MNTVTPPASLPEIAEAVRGVLDASVGGNAPSSFELRVASRLMAVVQRELEQGSGLGSAEREALCERITKAEVVQPLLDRLWSDALARLAIDNPNYRW